MTVSVAELHLLLLESRATVGVAESLTGGELAAALSSTPGASATLRGGLVVYATDLKATLAGVPAELLDERGPVDPDVAVALAAGARDRLGATFGVGVTGVAGPDRQDGVAVGTVFGAVAGPQRSVVESWSFGGSRDEIRAAAVAACVQLIAGECRRLAGSLG